MAYETRKTKKSQFTSGTATTADSFDFIQGGINKKAPIQNLINLVGDLYGASLRTYSTQSALVADDIQLGEYAIVEENAYAFYKVTNTAATGKDVALTSGLVATYQFSLGLSSDNELDTYDELRGLSPSNYAVGDVRYVSGDGIAGFFRVTTGSATDNGGTIITNATWNAASKHWERVYSGAVNVKWFGAVGDGVTDDATAVQNAINYLTSGAGEVEFKGGTFALGSTITVTKNVPTLTGDAGGSTEGVGRPTFVWIGASGGLMMDFDGAYGFTVNNISYDGANLAGRCVRVMHTSTNGFIHNGTFNKCSFIDCSERVVDIGGGIDPGNDDTATLAFNDCQFRKTPRTGYTSVNPTSLVRIRGFNTHGLTFKTCFFFGPNYSAGTNYPTHGIFAESGHFNVIGCVFHTRSLDDAQGADIYLAKEATDTVIPSSCTVIDCESQSPHFLKTFDSAPVAIPQKNTVLINVRHADTDALASSPRSIFWSGAGANSGELVMIGCKFHEDVEIGQYAQRVYEVGTKFVSGKGFTGYPAKVYGAYQQLAVTTGDYSFSGSSKIYDTNFITDPEPAIYELFWSVNGGTGSTSYRDMGCCHIYIVQDDVSGQKYNMELVQVSNYNILNTTEKTPSAVFWDGSSEAAAVTAANLASNEVRLKFDNCTNANSANYELRLRRVL